ncbi:MAG TPA: NAD-dependent protein deacetylase [Gammaproteobacteria bacterium]|jgi:NAD-dependent SIR2 family protein deacetylase|nr:NAD-dependent protein deacetylase [Gammaproteobacteria bacterium]
MGVTPQIEQLHRFVTQHPRVFVLSGAGLSTDSGIPDYRDEQGNWKVSQPIQGPAFVRDASVQKRYWARSVIGWRSFGQAAPNRGHRALARLEALGIIAHVVTQNVDGLHQRAGSREVTDLHGRLDRVICLDCEYTLPRRLLQAKLEAANPAYLDLRGPRAPDGDARLDHDDFEDFRLVPCPRCGGPLKPDVVFFGENVPATRVENAMQALADSDAMLVVGSSLMVYSGFRFCREAQRLGLPMAAINRGKTRADDLFTLKVSDNCATTLDALLTQCDTRA